MTQQNQNFWQRHFMADEAGKNLSWGSVFAGTIAFFASFLLLNLLTTAFGLGMFDPTSANPMEGVGTGTMIFFVLSLVISMFAGGFISGLASRYAGGIHGFLTWALAVVISLVLIVTGAASALGMAGNVVGSALGAAGDVAGGVASGVGSAVQLGGEAANKALGELDLDLSVDTEKVQGNAEKFLKDTEVKELQPDYLQGQMDEVKEEVQAAIDTVKKDPDQLKPALKDLSTSIEKRVKTITTSVDREDLTKAVASSKIIIGAFFIIALAIDILCL